MGGLGIYELIVVVFVLFLLGFAVAWILALVDILKSEFTGSNKLIWLLVVILVPVVGAIAYFIIGRKQKINVKGK